MLAKLALVKAAAASKWYKHRKDKHRKEALDKHRKEAEFKVGDLVLLQVKVAEKLAANYMGPYKILERVGPVAYRLELPTHIYQYPVFHVSKLREYNVCKRLVTDSTLEPHVLQKFTLDGKVVETIIGHKGTGRLPGKYLVKFAGLPLSKCKEVNGNFVRRHGPWLVDSYMQRCQSTNLHEDVPMTDQSVVPTKRGRSCPRVDSVLDEPMTAKRGPGRPRKASLQHEVVAQTAVERRYPSRQKHANE